MFSRLRQLKALMVKEYLQVFRDPSSIMIAFVLPMILLFVFGYGMSLDAKHVKTAVVLEDRSPAAQSLFRAFCATDYIDAESYANRSSAEEALSKGKVRAVLIIPNDFSSNINKGGANIQLLTDGSETNTATLVENYVFGVVQTYQSRNRPIAMLKVQQRVLFNPELNTRNALIPGSIVLVMAIIGTMLTAMVVSREWERGTMEAMLATPMRTIDTIAGKLAVYYCLGIISTAICVLISIFLFGVPFRGSLLALFAISSIFLYAALMQGYLISTVAKNQFISGQLSLVSAFLPNVFLSGALFEIASMPLFLRTLTYLFPGRYYVTCLQTLFMAGDVWTLLLPNMGYMAVIGLFFTVMTFIKTPKRLM